MSVNRAKSLRQNSTDAERRLWSRLRRHQLESCQFRRQSPIGKYVVDFVCPDRRLVVEVDGGQHADQAEQDDARSEWLESQGYTVLRFWNNDVLKNTEVVVETIRDALRERPEGAKRKCSAGSSDS